MWPCNPEVLTLKHAQMSVTPSDLLVLGGLKNLNAELFLESLKYTIHIFFIELGFKMSNMNYIEVLWSENLSYVGVCIEGTLLLQSQ